MQSRYPQARWSGPVPNERPRGMVAPLLGFVMHSEQGSEGGTDAWFHNPRSEASAHLGFAKVGSVDQFVAFDDRAWAEAGGNSRWLSGEFEGFAGEPLTSAQLRDAGEFYAWAHQQAPASFPFRTSESPTEAGFGWHGMGGLAWGGHIGCPGDARKAQRPTILAEAIRLVHPVPVIAVRNEPAYPAHPLHLGDHGPAVLEIQERLRARGWKVGNNGAYDEHTMHAVAEFEAEKDLRVDGITGPVVWWSLWHLPL